MWEFKIETHCKRSRFTFGLVFQGGRESRWQRLLGSLRKRCPPLSFNKLCIFSSVFVFAFAFVFAGKPEEEVPLPFPSIKLCIMSSVFLFVFVFAGNPEEEVPSHFLQ